MKTNENMVIPPFKVQFNDHETAYIMEHIEKVIKSGRLTLGTYTQQFEEAFCAFSDVTHAIAVNSGTSALEIVLRSLDITDKEVLVPVNTNFATAIAAMNAGGTVRFYDGGLFPELEHIEKKTTRKTNVLIVVHIGGYITGEMERIVRYCRENDIILIEDASHAHGASLNGQKAGSFGLAGIFSLFPTKTITTCEGGVITTNSEEIYSLSMQYRDQGKRKTDGLHVYHGNSWRMSELHAIVGLSMLQSGVKDIHQRLTIIKHYETLLTSCDHITFPKLSDHHIPAGYKCVAFVESMEIKRRLYDYLKDKNIILAKGVYDIPLHRQPLFNDMIDDTFPTADDFSKKHICLPLWKDISPRSIERICTEISNFFLHHYGH